MLRTPDSGTLHPHRRVHRFHLPRPHGGHGPHRRPLADTGHQVRCVLHRVPRILRTNRHSEEAVQGPVPRGHHHLRRPRDGRCREAVLGIRPRLPRRNAPALRDGGRHNAKPHRAQLHARYRVPRGALHPRVHRIRPRTGEGLRREADRTHGNQLREGEGRCCLHGLRDRRDRRGHALGDPGILPRDR